MTTGNGSPDFVSAHLIAGPRGILGMNCPNCNSEQIQKLSLVFENGLSHINTRTSGTGIGFGPGGIGVGVGAGRTQGVQMTATAAKAAPPQRKRLAGLIILAIVFFAFGKTFPILFIGTLICGFVAYQNFRFNREVFPGLYGAWDAAYMCARCGVIAPPNMRQAQMVGPSPDAIYTHEQAALSPNEQ
jgi:hypothetical protein